MTEKQGGPYLLSDLTINPTIEYNYQPFIDKLNELRKLAARHHYDNEEDPWYGCPLSTHGCSHELQDKNKCNCGADTKNKEINDKIDEIISLLK